MRLSDSIEQFIKTMLAQDEQEVELSEMNWPSTLAVRLRRSTMCLRHALRRTTAISLKAAAAEAGISVSSVCSTIPESSLFIC